MIGPHFPVSAAITAASTPGAPPDALATVIAADTGKWGPIVQALGLKGD